MAKQIKINGTIGTYKDEGGVEVKGVELVDVISQVEAIAQTENEIQVIINSPGGLVDVGYSIYDYLTSLKKQGKTITTIINGMCASIATIIALAGDKRQIVKGSKFLIHNPYLNNVTGDADMMREYAQTLDIVEGGLAKFYSKVTGIGQSAIDLLMKEDKEITSEKALELKFVTEIIDGQLEEVKNLSIVAVIKQTNYTMEIKNVLKQGKDALAKLTEILAKAKKEVIKNETVKTQDGKSLTVDGGLNEGSTVSIDGQPTPNATYILADGTTIKTDDNSKITSVTKQPSTAAAVYEHANIGDVIHDTEGNVMKNQEIKTQSGKTFKTDESGKVVEVKDMAANILSPDQIITLKKENEELKAVVAEMKKINDETVEKIEVLSKLSSSFTPTERKTIFNKTKTPGQTSNFADEVKARRIERATKTN